MPLELLTPRFLEKIWGSEHLQPWFPNTAVKTGAKIGEVWFEGPGPLELPLLVKFLFTSAKLSVQVHPDDAYAAQHHASRGKTEMWHVLAAEPGARIAAGFRQPVSAEHLRTAARTGEIEDLLAWHAAAPGDTFFIPAGTVHAIGGGLVLCEIQQRSDITYRLYDYGRPRELHIEQSLAVARREPHSARVDALAEELISCNHFTVGRRAIQGSGEFGPPPADFVLFIVIQGEGAFSEGTPEAHPVRAGQVWYAPGGTPPFVVSGKVTLLWASSSSDRRPV
jgi:mannose-6-phosphate isomerase